MRLDHMVSNDVLQDVQRKTVGAFLRRARDLAGLTQTEVGRHLGYSTAQFISNWERGLSLPPMNAIGPLIGLYNVTPAQFVEAFDDMESELRAIRRRVMFDVIRGGA